MVLTIQYITSHCPNFQVEQWYIFMACIKNHRKFPYFRGEDVKVKMWDRFLNQSLSISFVCLSFMLSVLPFGLVFLLYYQDWQYYRILQGEHGWVFQYFLFCVDCSSEWLCFSDYYFSDDGTGLSMPLDYLLFRLDSDYLSMLMK